MWFGYGYECNLEYSMKYLDLFSVRAIFFLSTIGNWAMKLALGHHFCVGALIIYLSSPLQCYIDPSGGRKFYSKAQASRYLETVNSCSTPQRSISTVDDVCSILFILFCLLPCCRFTLMSRHSVLYGLPSIVFGIKQIHYSFVCLGSLRGTSCSLFYFILYLILRNFFLQK